MTNLCTKVTVRQRKLAKGKVSLYLDYYPAIRHPRTGRMTRREYLGIYIYANPTERFQQEYNRSMMKKAELIKCRRTESVINDQFGFLDRAKGRESFLDYFEKQMQENEYGHNWQTLLWRQLLLRRHHRGLLPEVSRLPYVGEVRP